MRAELSQENVTDLLLQWNAGSAPALERLMAVVYDELHDLAEAYLRREREDHTLETSALVHEAYLRLIDQKKVQWQNRTHFFGIAAQMMRRILVDHARSHLYAKRGAGAPKLSLDEALTLSLERAPELVALDEALDRLAHLHPQQAKIVELRFFVGLSAEEISQILGVSSRTVTRGWRIARAWLYDCLSEGEHEV